ncbi:MAG TPA: hypothetical protein VEJ43_04590 [Pseudolabrys sp.]|nr:hypothetical protein [Pseudolabrys sp.]
METADILGITAAGLWLPLAAVVGVVAHKRGRFGLAWFLISVLVYPVIPGLLVLALPRVKRAEPQTASSEGPEEPEASPTFRLIFIAIAAAMIALFGWSLVPPIQNWNNPNEDGFSYIGAFWTTIVCLPVALYLVRGAIAGQGQRLALARKALVVGCGVIVIVVAFLVFQHIENAKG